MATIKCCVVGCTTNKTHRLYYLPKDDKLRALWLSFLVPVNSGLLGLSKNQLIYKRVCQKHFDKYQLDYQGNRHKDGYPCLFSTEEIEHGVPLSGDTVYDHNYSKKEDIEAIAEDLVVAQEHPVDHLYSRPASNPPESSFLNTEYPVDHQYLKPASPASSILNSDSTTVNILELGEIPLASECEESLHGMHIDFLNGTQIDFFEPQGIETDQILLSDPSGLIDLQPKPSLGSDHFQPKPSFGADCLQPKLSFMAERYRFRQRKQNPNESIVQYILKLEDMTKFCNFDASLEENLRDQLVCGLRSKQIRQRLFVEESLDYAKAVEIACAMETEEIGAVVAEQTVGCDAESGDREVTTTRVLHSDSSAEVQKASTNDSWIKCSVCRSADYCGEGCGQSRLDIGICKQKGHLNRARPMRLGSRQQDRYDTTNTPGLVAEKVDQLSKSIPPSSDNEDWKTEEDQLARKGFKRLVIWVDETQLPMDIDMQSLVSCVRST